MAWIHGGREVALAVIAGAALGTSRRFPRLTWLVVAGVTLAAAADDSLLGGEEFIAYALIPAHAFLAGRWDPHWRGLGGPIALSVTAEIGAFRADDSQGVFVVAVIALWLAGRAVRERELLAAALAERVEELAREQEAYAQLSVRYERARIAAELHDVVAHAISVMVIQAGAGQRLAASDPQRTREAFEAIAGAAREAESDLGRLVELLGEQEATGTLPDLALIEELVARAADSGLDVCLRMEGDTGNLPVQVVALAHRVVQEGVTNALRYATGAPVRVLVRGDRQAMLVEVANDPATGDAAFADSGTGNGLRGLRERAAALGGTIQAGPCTGGGWRLAAHLPR